MTARSETVAKLLAALSTVEGLRPAPPVPRSTVVWNTDALAFDVDAEVVRVRLVATTLPLPPSLTEAGEVVAKTLAGTPFAAARVELVVTDVDSAAFDRAARP
ncbi:hypothetical protein FPZ12_001675 [Amycolatopsis acidicola]|uniref:Asp23/Gls24 family envelope stress response protein n=1 Tax=Amycolatopsis acidicola TaxID=2596893 RepID=A0A5N0VL97_9PSEU|nr:hypothetical protein [Amycolatopsis acidicola]KAA9166303.1 hypothetical protein FPZ12_001675 [Amycolatopsis acidicola]